MRTQLFDNKRESLSIDTTSPPTKLVSTPLTVGPDLIDKASTRFFFIIPSPRQNLVQSPYIILWAVNYFHQFPFLENSVCFSIEEICIPFLFFIQKIEILRVYMEKRQIFILRHSFILIMNIKSRFFLIFITVS